VGQVQGDLVAQDALDGAEAQVEGPIGDGNQVCHQSGADSMRSAWTSRSTLPWPSVAARQGWTPTMR
jgi:hypothetical protein